MADQAEFASELEQAQNVPFAMRFVMGRCMARRRNDVPKF
jgi:hypothetical protein